MKYLDNIGLGYFYSKLKSKVKIVEKKYVYVTPSRQTVSFTVPDFNANTCTLEVYVNGLMCIEGAQYDYTLSGNIVSLTKELDANQTCYFVVKSITL